MQNLPIDVLENVFLFIPIGETINDETSKKEIERLLDEKVLDFKNNGIEVFKYIWSSVEKDKTQSSIVRFTICCNEYITEIVIIDCGTREVKTWNLGTPISKRDILDIPKMYINPGSPDVITKYYYKGYIITHQGNHTKLHRLKYNIHKDIDWDDFLDFLMDGKSNKLSIERIRFLDYNIIETLVKPTEHTLYYSLLNAFDALYAEGYWTYGGFKNYSDSGNLLPDNIYVRYLPDGTTRHKAFQIGRDGKLSNHSGMGQKLKHILIELGAHI